MERFAGDRITRRAVERAALAGAVGGLVARHGADAAEDGKPGGKVPDDRIRVGFIGVGNRGDQVLDAFLALPDCDVTALADLHPPYLDAAAGKVAARRGAAPPTTTTDYRRILDRDDVDAVVVATPDHWHALQAIHAIRAGKDVYVEKPLGLVVAEGRRIADAARDHGRVVQVGIQRLSSPMLGEVAGLIADGRIGKVTAARAFHLQNEWPRGIGSPPDEDPPEGFDWDAWQGPAPERMFNRNRTFYRFRWFPEYSGGQLTNFGTHYLATIHRVLGLEAPLASTALGGRFAAYDNRVVPDTLEVLWHYPGDVLVSFTQFNASAAPAAAKACEVEIRGTLGTLYLHGRGWEIVPETITDHEFPVRSPIDRQRERGWRKGERARIEAAAGKGAYPDQAHARDFLDCVRSRATPSCGIEFGHRATSAVQIGAIALRTRSVVEWDATRERFIDHPRADALLDYDYREPWRLDS